MGKENLGSQTSCELFWERCLVSLIHGQGGGNLCFFFCFFPSQSSSYSIRAHLVGWKVDDGNGNECKGVKMESRDKLGNDEM